MHIGAGFGVHGNAREEEEERRENNRLIRERNRLRIERGQGEELEVLEDEPMSFHYLD